MSKQFKGSIDLTEIGNKVRAGHGAVKKSEKNGRQYLNITIWMNDEPDKYGNIGSIQIWDKATNETTYIGNYKEGAKTEPVTKAETTEDKSDDLPF